MRTITSKEFGKNIRKRRVDLNMTQAELAEAIGISTNQLSSIETGKSKTRFDVIAALCETLDVTPDYLMLGTLHNSNVSQNIIDVIKKCPENKQHLVYKMVLDIYNHDFEN